MIFIQNFLLLASPLITLALFSYVFGQRRKNRINTAFLILISINIFETICDFALRLSSSVILRETLLIILTSLFFASSFVFLNFTYALFNKKADLVYKISAVLGAVCTIIPLFNIRFYSIMPGHLEGIYTPIPNILFSIIFVGYFCPMVVYGVVLTLIHTHKTSDPIIKKYLLIWIGGIIATVCYFIMVTFILPVLFKITFIASFGSLSIIIALIPTFWLVRRYNFLSVNVAQMEEILEKVFSETGEAIMLVDKNLKIVRANKVARTTFNLDKTSSCPVYLQSVIPELDRYKDSNPFEASITVEGEQRSLLVSVTVLHTADETIHTIVTARDITKLKQAEKDMFRQQQLESLGLLAGGIAHDFNNLLSGIISSFNVAQLNVESHSETAKILLEGEKAALNARRLTQQLITFAKGGVPVATVFNPVELLRDVCSYSVRGTNIRITFDFPDDSYCMQADETQIRQVFQNLVINACQAMGEGGLIKVYGRCVQVYNDQIPALRAGNYLKVSVEDQGCGIPVEILPRVFEPYFTTKKDGNGIGLAVVYSIISKHNGHISVESQTGKGTVFTVYLPVMFTQLKPVSNALKIATDGHRGSGKVLVMDDDDIIRRTLAALLQKLGYEVDTAKNGEEALEMFEQIKSVGQNYSFIIIDLMVSNGMGGKKLAREIALRDASIPVVISSGYSEDFSKSSNNTDMNFAAYLQKPYNIKELQAFLQKFT